MSTVQILKLSECEICLFYCLFSDPSDASGEVTVKEEVNDDIADVEIKQEPVDDELPSLADAELLPTDLSAVLAENDHVMSDQLLPEKLSKVRETDDFSCLCN